MRDGATQVSLPGTLPTPAQARSNLRLARAEVREKSDVWDGMKDRRDAARDELKAAMKEVEEAEDDLLDAPGGSPEDLAADGRHQKTCKRACNAATDLEKVNATLKLARGELRAAEKRLATARADIQAVRAGRKMRR